MTTTHRTHLVLWATFAALVGVLSALLARGTSICQVGVAEVTLADEAPATWWMFAILAAAGFGLAAIIFAVARVRKDEAPCPHCGKPVVPRVNMVGELELVAPGGAPPSSPAPPAAP